MNKIIEISSFHNIFCKSTFISHDRLLYLDRAKFSVSDVGHKIFKLTVPKVVLVNNLSHLEVMHCCSLAISLSH